MVNPADPSLAQDPDGSPRGADSAASAEKPFVGPGEILTIRVDNNLEGFKRGSRLVSGQLSTWHVSERTRYVTELALEEILTNIIRYGYPEPVRRGIDITLKQEGGDVILTLEDDGIPFDPTTRTSARSSTSIDEAAIGGRGLAMVRTMVKHMRYHHQAGRNHLELTVQG